MHDIHRIKKWIPSRYNVRSSTEDGHLLLYNTFTGAIIEVDSNEKSEILSMLTKHGTIENLSTHFLTLKEQGFLVPDSVDEDERAKALRESLRNPDVIHWIIMPTEACNFRCTYCYQTFGRGKMSRDTVNGIKRLLDSKLGTVRTLSVSWFGGEPLLASDVIEELSEYIKERAYEYGFHYSSDIATNAYFLTRDLFRHLLSWNVRQFMITLDGLAHIHDGRRILVHGGGTFSKIIENLKNAQSIPEEFEIYIRVNFDMETLNQVPELIEFLARHFSGDKRFQMFFRPVGRWGGMNDDKLPVCDDRTANLAIWEFTKLAIESGLSMASIIENSLLPGGSVCYASKPHSLVFGANGRLHKCTCALDEDVNQVGKIRSDGTLDLDEPKIAHWVNSGDIEDTGCRSCFYRPSCQGNHCPLYRMKTGLRPCPSEKRKIKKVLDLIASEDQ
ncbi:radical SAM protein [Alicyclobacillus tolerans]|uniref:radical SAM/SPASM domain-containing protein n=1 Tax=Alicyclobacillus tolerans TaxID=90970 RepID=UPI001F00B1CA|nr:radical SAM protein [Alicyclobacillus tolerans]MCF8564858.1 radical SAM protein [Alicyclobacillus tolerans]